MKKCLDELVGRSITSKSEAMTGVAGTPRERIEIGQPVAVHSPRRDTLTLAQLLAEYLREYVAHERPRSLPNVHYQVPLTGHALR